MFSGTKRSKPMELEAFGLITDNPRPRAANCSSGTSLPYTAELLLLAALLLPPPTNPLVADPPWILLPPTTAERDDTTTQSPVQR